MKEKNVRQSRVKLTFLSKRLGRYSWALFQSATHNGKWYLMKSMFLKVKVGLVG